MTKVFGPLHVLHRRGIHGIALGWNSLVEENTNIIHTKYSGVLRTYDEVIQAMAKSTKYQNFIPLVRLMQGIEMLKLKEILRIIENSTEDSAKDFLQFCFSIISPLCAKAKSEHVEDKNIFDDVHFLMYAALDIEKNYWKVLWSVIEEGWTTSYGGMLSLVRGVFQEYDEVFPEAKAILTLPLDETQRFTDELLQRIFEYAQEI